jgi:hypothetical protein
MERRRPEEIRLHVLWRQVIAGGQPGLVELHGPVGGGEQPAAKPDFHMSDGWDDADRMAWRHDQFNGSGDIAIPFVGGLWLMPVDLEQFADRDGAPRRLDKGGGR